MAALDFPETPTGTVGELWRAVVRLLPQLQRRVIRGAQIETSETPVAHGMKAAPQMGIPVALGNATVWATRGPDSKYLYFCASSVVTVDVEIVP